MMERSVFPGLSTRVVFGAGTLAQTEAEVRRLGHERVLALSTPAQRAEAQRLAASFGGVAAGVFAGAATHTPVETTAEAVEAFRASGASAVVSLGGGSTAGLGKAIRLRTGTDQVVIPTTYARSEMTDVLGETAAGQKTPSRSPDVRPETVIYDVDLTLSLPIGLTGTSAMNAIAHAMEAFYAPDRNPVVLLMCRDALAAFRAAIPRLCQNPRNLSARHQALYAAWCCSAALGSVSTALHHKQNHGTAIDDQEAEFPDSLDGGGPAAGRHGTCGACDRAGGAVAADGQVEPAFERDRELHHAPTTWPGARLPHVWVFERSGRAISTLDLCGGGEFTLLTGIGGEAWVAAAGAALGLPLRTHVVGPRRAIEDHTGDWARTREIGDAGCLLVRPDQHVCWRATAPAVDPEAELRRVLTSVLAR